MEQYSGNDVFRIVKPPDDTLPPEKRTVDVMKNDDLNEAVAYAQIKLGIITPALRGFHDEKNNRAYFEKVSLHEITMPDGSKRRFGAGTYAKWYWLYNKYGFEALLPSDRKDKGKTRVLSQGCIDEIFRLKKEHPKLNATQIHGYLIENGFTEPTVSVSTLQRFVKKNELKGTVEPQCRDRKAFEAGDFGVLWQADTCQLCILRSDGEYKWVYVMGIIDDHSRLIVGVECFFADNAENFQKVFKNAVSTFGLCSMLLVDNGSPYSNVQLSMICGELGTSLINLRPRDGAGKGKIERWWKSLQSGLLAWLDTKEIHSCEEMTERVREWVLKYNHRVHSGIGCTPYERYIVSTQRCLIRRPESAKWLDECFHNRITRKVRNDSTISIDSMSYDVPPQFARMKVEVRFIPRHMKDTAYILYDGEKFPIRLTDRVENSKTKRNNQLRIDLTMLGGGKQNDN